MDEEQLNEFLAVRQHFVDSLKINGLGEGCCPALVAENLQRQCERNLIESAHEFFGVTLNNLICAGLDKYDKYIELLVGMTLAYRRDTK